jgi:large subunit ribosomal protein L3
MADAKSPAGPATSRIAGLGLLGRKVGMTRIFNDDGESVAVTVLEVSDNRVTQIKTAETDGYTAVQLAHGVRKPSRIRKPQAGHFAKAGVQGGSALREFRLKESNKKESTQAGPPLSGDLKVGITLGVDQFEVGQKVDVTGVSIGKGFSGAIKRHHFSSNRASHGNSVSTNAPGSIGMRQDPGRVMPGKRMAGHLGDVRRTTHNLVIARIDAQRQLLLVRGAVPGARGGSVIVRPAVKAR